MSLNAALVDRARCVVQQPVPVKVEGTTQFAPVRSEWFRCRLTVAEAPEGATTDRSRAVDSPSLMVGVKDLAGGVVSITSEVRIEVDSRELGARVYDVTGDPAPIRKKRRLLGWTVPLRRVLDHPFEVPTP